jgi:hypothetical protein
MVRAFKGQAGEGHAGVVNAALVVHRRHPLAEVDDAGGATRGRSAETEEGELEEGRRSVGSGDVSKARLHNLSGSSSEKIKPPVKGSAPLGYHFLGYVGTAIIRAEDDCVDVEAGGRISSVPRRTSPANRERHRVESKAWGEESKTSR